MRATTKDKATKKAASPRTQRGMSPQSERYECRETGFYLIKTTSTGVEVETLLSNFTASILTEFQSLDSKGNPKVEGFMVEVLYRDWRSVFQVPVFEGRFDSCLLRRAMQVHPMTFIAPGKDDHVINAIKALSTPRIHLKSNGTESKASIPKTKR